MRCCADPGGQPPGLVESRRGVGVYAGGRVEHVPQRSSVVPVHPSCSVGVAVEEPGDLRGDARVAELQRRGGEVNEVDVLLLKAPRSAHARPHIQARTPDGAA